MSKSERSSYGSSGTRAHSGRLGGDGSRGPARGTRLPPVAQMAVQFPNLPPIQQKQMPRSPPRVRRRE